MYRRRQVAKAGAVLGNGRKRIADAVTFLLRRFNVRSRATGSFSSSAKWSSYACPVPWRGASDWKESQFLDYVANGEYFKVYSACKRCFQVQVVRVATWIIAGETCLLHSITEWKMRLHGRENK